MHFFNSVAALAVIRRHLLNRADFRIDGQLRGQDVEGAGV